MDIGTSIKGVVPGPFGGDWDDGTRYCQYEKNLPPAGTKPPFWLSYLPKYLVTGFPVGGMKTDEEIIYLEGELPLSPLPTVPYAYIVTTNGGGVYKAKSPDFGGVVILEMEQLQAPDDVLGESRGLYRHVRDGLAAHPEEPWLSMVWQTVTPEGVVSSPKYHSRYKCRRNRTDLRLNKLIYYATPYQLTHAGIETTEEIFFQEKGYGRSTRDMVHAGVMSATTALLRWEMSDRTGPKKEERNELLRVLDNASRLAVFEAAVHKVTHEIKMMAVRPKVLSAALAVYEDAVVAPTGLKALIDDVALLSGPKHIIRHHNIGATVIPGTSVPVKRQEPRMSSLEILTTEGAGVLLSPSFDPDVYKYTADWSAKDEDSGFLFPYLIDTEGGTFKRISLNGVDLDLSLTTKGISGVVNGDNELVFETVAEDPAFEKTYTVTITK